MKDPAHHRKHVQRKILQSAKREVQKSLEKKHAKKEKEEKSSKAESEIVWVEDSKRSGTAECVRHMDQRERRH